MKNGMFAGVKRFFIDDMWDDARFRDRGKLFPLIRIIRLIIFTIGRVIETRMTVAASSLAYITVLSLVPFLTVTFAIFSFAGGMEKIGKKIEILILSNFGAGQGDVVVRELQEFIGNIHGGAIGPIGFFMLLFTSISLLTRIEKSFNYIWGIKKARPLVKRGLIYWGILTLGPIFLAISIVVGTALQTNMDVVVSEIPDLSFIKRFSIKTIPYLFSVVLFSLVYRIMPNTRVGIRAAFVGGIFSGCVWEVAKLLYIILTRYMISYDRIYGAFSSILFFFIWIYITWMIILVGGAIVYSIDNLKSIEDAKSRRKLNFRMFKILVVAILVHVGRLVEKGEGPVTEEYLEERLGLPGSLIREVLFRMEDIGLLYPIAESEDVMVRFLPAVSLHTTRAQDVISLVESSDGEEIRITPENESVLKLFEHIERDSAKMLQNPTIMELSGVLAT